MDIDLQRCFFELRAGREATLFIRSLEDEIARLRLTDAEREAILGAIEAEHGRGAWQWAATLRTLLERTA